MQSEIEKVFTFSNDVVETSLKALAKGEGIRTTYGTDFDCVAASTLERGYPQAVVITDDDSQGVVASELLEACKKLTQRVLQESDDDGIERKPQRSRPLPWTARVWQVRIGRAVAPLVRMEPGKVAPIETESSWRPSAGRL